MVASRPPLTKKHKKKNKKKFLFFFESVFLSNTRRTMETGEEDIQIEAVERRCPECGCTDLQDVLPEDETVCTNCGLVVFDQAFMERRGPPKESTLEYWKGVLDAAKAEAKALPKGCTYQAIFHYNERLAQLDCTDPDIPKPLMDAIRKLHLERASGPGGREYLRQPFTREFIEREILAHVSWPKDLLINKKRNLRRKTPLQTFSERWIRIRYELTGLRPRPMTIEFRKAMQELFKDIANSWPEVRHDPHCRYATTGVCDGKRSRLFVCRHNLPHFNWMTQQMIIHLIHWNPAYSYADEYIDYLPAIETPKRLELLKQQWMRLYKYTGIPYYTVRPLRPIPALSK